MKPWFWHDLGLHDRDRNRDGRTDVEQRVLLLWHAAAHRPFPNLVLRPLWVPDQQHFDRLVGSGLYSNK